MCCRYVLLVLPDRDSKMFKSSDLYVDLPFLMDLVPKREIISNSLGIKRRRDEPEVVFSEALLLPIRNMGCIGSVSLYVLHDGCMNVGIS